MTASLTILPGWGLGRGPLEPLAQALGGRILDLPGYHGTPRIADFPTAVEAVAANLSPGSVLIGWSLGSLLALATAARHPERVGKLALIAATASFCCRDGWPHAMPPATLAEFSAAVHTDFASLLPRFIGNFNRGDRHAKALTRTLLAHSEPDLPPETLATGLNWLRDVDLRPHLPEIVCPVLILHGAHDPLMPLDAARMLAERLPRSRLEILAGTAHAPFLSDPDRVLELLRAFL